MTIPSHSKTAPRKRRRLSRRDLLTFGAQGWTVAFSNGEAVVAGLQTILHGWQLSLAGPETAAADVRIWKTGRGYSWRSQKLSKPVLWQERAPRTAMEVVADVHDVLFDWYLQSRPDTPCLHAGAVRIGDGLVCLTGQSRAGKSTLCGELLAAGHQLYCDDVLPIDPVTFEGIGMGIAPVLRLPAPATPRARIAAFSAARLGPRSRNRAYLAVEGGRVAPFGSRAPVRHIVLLERKEGEKARLVPLSVADTLRELIMRNFGSRADTRVALAKLHTVVAAAHCHRLIYSDLREAADLIERQCGEEGSHGRC